MKMQYLGRSRWFHQGPLHSIAIQTTAAPHRLASALANSFSEGLPQYVKDRVQLWDQLKEKKTEDDAKDIKVCFPQLGGKEVKAVASKDSPITVGKGLFQQPIVAKVNGTELWDLTRALEADCSLEFFDFNTKEGQEVLWHSTAHLLGQALELYFKDKVQLCDGPALRDKVAGFFYEMKLLDDLTVHERDLDPLNEAIKGFVKAKQKFERLQVTREEARELFAANPFKIEMIESIPSDQELSVYRCGPFIDLCRGPHVINSGFIGAAKLIRCSAAQSSKDNERLQRVYGIAFPKRSHLQEWETNMEEAKRRDHRVIGQSQGLFMFHQYSPGSTFMLPHGTRIYNKLCAFLREEYKKRGYEEVLTPNIFKKELWQISGHLENYQEDMYMVTPAIKEHGSNCEDSEHEHEVFGLKPMNCPGHCLIFKNSRLYSYRDLPVRLADFSALHRNEASGALSGLTRVRRFHQDDAHIFCRADQIQEEIKGCLDFINSVYSKFKFRFKIFLSTRPDKFVGSIETWDDAEEQLRLALNNSGLEWKLNPKDGAFYGPKIDITVLDALNREFQCATIQLDFQLPQRFGLGYKGADGENHAPIIIHRAIYGSLERFMAILIEHTAGAWPLWLSPRQVAVLPISDEQDKYASECVEKLKANGFYADLMHPRSTLQKRIRESQLAGYNYILVVGEREEAEGTVNVRTRDNKVHGGKTLDALLHELSEVTARFE